MPAELLKGCRSGPSVADSSNRPLNYWQPQPNDQPLPRSIFLCAWPVMLFWVMLPTASHSPTRLSKSNLQPFCEAEKCFFKLTRHRYRYLCMDSSPKRSQFRTLLNWLAARRIAEWLMAGLVALTSAARAAELKLPFLWQTDLQSFLESAATVADLNGDGRDKMLVA